MNIIKKTAFLFILLTGLSVGAYAQKDPKKPPPPKPDRPVVVPKPKDNPKDKPKKPEYSFFAVNPKARQESV